MKTGKVRSVTAGKPFQGQRGMLYGWWVTIDNGDRISVNTQSEDRKPWEVGDEAHYDIVKTHEGKNGPWHSAKKARPDGFMPTGGTLSAAPRSTGWSPEKETRIEVQGLVQAAIAGGASTQEEIEAKVAMGMKAVSVIAPKVMAKRSEAVTSDQQAPYQASPSKLPTNPAAGAVYQGSRSVSIVDDEEAPF